MSIDPQIKAAFYLSPSLDDLWRWSEDGEVLTWADGTTIAFRAEVEQVLRRLAPGGLPPFGAVALLLGACRDGWADSHGRHTISGYAGAFARMVGPPAGGAPSGGAAQMVFARVGHHISQLIAGLDSIGSLPPALREKTDARQVLAETVFEGLENRGSVEDARAVILALDEGISPESLRPRLSQEESLSQFSRQVDGLSRGLGRVDAQTLANRLKTGLDQDLVPPEEDLSPPQRVRRLLAALRDDPELGGLARLAHDLMAAATIPRSLHAREDLPAGGVSDLSNRGPLDRLLVSELAHDDLTLAVRVAVNEALYLRRESPPSEPPHRRAILVDLGIRMWGVPRLYAIATGLALACTTDPKVQFDFFRATHSGVEAVDVTRRPGVESLLTSLEPSPHPAQSLEAFFDRLDNADGPEPGRIDAILVTHPDVMADEDFLKALAPYREKLNYLATVDRDGSFALWALSRRGMKLVRQAKLSLDQILSPPVPRGPRTSPPLLSEEDRRLPAILYADPFPFLLPHRANPRTSAVSQKLGLVTVTDDGRLLHWQTATRGGRQLAARLPASSTSTTCSTASRSSSPRDTMRQFSSFPSTSPTESGARRVSTSTWPTPSTSSHARALSISSTAAPSTHTALPTGPKSHRSRLNNASSGNAADSSVSAARGTRSPTTAHERSAWNL
jgi:MoxR-vWA-beta-propeller ternary system protein